MHGLLAATAADAGAVHNIPLLGLVAHPACLVRARRPCQADHARELAVLPATNAEEEAEHIALLLLPQLLNILRGKDGRQRSSDEELMTVQQEGAATSM